MLKAKDFRQVIQSERLFIERTTFLAQPTSKVLATTGDMETVAQLLGHASIDCSQRYVDVDQATLEAMFADAL